MCFKLSNCRILELFFKILDSLLAQTVKNLLVIREIRVWSLGWKYPLEKEMATHSGILAWRIPRTEEPGGLQSMESQKVRPWATNSQLISVNLFRQYSNSSNFIVHLISLKYGLAYCSYIYQVRLSKEIEKISIWYWRFEPYDLMILIVLNWRFYMEHYFQL